MTSSRKHALFLRKWKVSEVWWGLGVCSSSPQGSPLCLTPHPRGGLIGEKMSSVAPTLSPSTPPTPNPQKPEKLGRVCFSQRQGEGNNDPGDWKDGPGVMPGGPCCVISVFNSPLPPQASHLGSLFSPLWLAKPDIWLLCCHSCCAGQGWCDQRPSRGCRGLRTEGPAGEAWLCPACRTSFLLKPSLSL